MSTAQETISKAYQARREGNLVLARDLYSLGARLHRKEADLLAYANAVRHVADIHQDEGNQKKAKPLYEEVLELFRSRKTT